MSDRPNALQMPAAPGGEDNALLANAWDANRQAYADWLARDRQNQIAMGYVDPQTGALTPAGWKAQAQIVGGGFGPADIGAMGIGAIKNYHGSPHLFEPTPKNPLGEFRLDKIGTGEGNQMFGYGPYTAGREGLAEGYRDTLSAKIPSETYIGGKLIPRDQLTPAMTLAAGAVHWPGDPIANLGKLKPGNLYTPEVIAEAQRLIAAGGVSYHQPKGHMYEVNINAEPGEFLHWDKSLADQPQGAAAHAIYEQTNPSVSLPLTATGQQLHAALSRQLGGDAAAAEALQNAGVAGIRYLDRGSRFTSAEGGAQHVDTVQDSSGKWRAVVHHEGQPDPALPNTAPQKVQTKSPPFATKEAADAWANDKVEGGTHNHVTFNPEIMEIVRRYGIAGLIGGGAAAAGGQDQGNQ